MTTTTVYYPWRQWVDSLGSFHGAGSGKQKTFTFPDTITGVSSVDFSGMKTSNGSSVTIRNTTSKVNGTFTVTVYDENSNAIGASVVNVNKSSTVNMSTLSKITLPSNSSVKKITFYSSTRNAHTSVNTDDSSVFELVYTRTSSISFTPYSSAVGWISNESGSSFRIVQRVDYAYRKIANISDVVLLTNLQTGSLVHGLLPGETYLLALQQFGSEWFDIAQNTVTTNQTGITDINFGSSTMTVTWEEDFPGALYTLTATNPEGSSKTVQTTELSSTITGLTPGTNYEVTISSEA